MQRASNSSAELRILRLNSKYYTSNQQRVIGQNNFRAVYSLFNNNSLSVVLLKHNTWRILSSIIRDIIDIIYFKLKKLLLSFLYLIEILKHLLQTEQLRTIKNSESVAAYIYRLLLLTIFASVCSDFLLKLYLLIYSRIV